MPVSYTRVNWTSDMFVNPSNMNQMDLGIKTVSDAVDAMGNTISTKRLIVQPQAGWTGLSVVGAPNSWADVMVSDGKTGVYVELLTATNHMNVGVYSNGYSPDGESLTESGLWLVRRGSDGKVHLPSGTIVDGTLSTTQTTYTAEKEFAGTTAWADTGCSINIPAGRYLVYAFASYSKSAPTGIAICEHYSTFLPCYASNETKFGTASRLAASCFFEATGATTLYVHAKWASANTNAVKIVAYKLP